MATSQPHSRSITTGLSRALIALAIVSVSVSISVNVYAQAVTNDVGLPSVLAVDAKSLPLIGVVRDGAADSSRENAFLESTSDRPFNIVLASFIGSASTDLSVSMYQIGRGVAREGGFGAWWQDSPVVFAASKSALAVAFAYGLERLHKTRPRTAFVMGIAATSLEGWLVARSARMGQAPPVR